jgi:hypothetical protein
MKRECAFPPAMVWEKVSPSTPKNIKPPTKAFKRKLLACHTRSLKHIAYINS